MLKRSLLFFCLIIATIITNAQDNALVNNLYEYMKSVRENTYSSSPDKELYKEDNAFGLLELLQIYYTDTLPRLRSKAYYLTYKCAYRSANKELKHKAVYNLVQGLKDEDSGNIGNVAEWLTSFKSSDFNEMAKDSLRAIYKRQKMFEDRILKIVAFAGLNDQIDNINNNLVNGNYASRKSSWAAHLSLARMGVKSELDYCLNLINKQPVNDDFIYSLAPDLVFIRQKEAIDILVKILMDDSKLCFSSNPENPQKISCGYRVMEYLAPIIENYPIQTDYTGDLLTDDYENSLLTVRVWFNGQSGGYSLNKDVY